MVHLFIQFVFPGFLFALTAVAIPVIIHLFHFRRFRRVFFSNVSFLQQLSDASKKESKIKHLLILAMRILAIVALVMAFARPYIPVADARIGSEGHAVGVYIDNSFSMDALGESGRLLDMAKTRALGIASVYQPTDRFLLLTNDFEGRHQRFVSREEFVAMVGEIEVSSGVRTLAQVMERKKVMFSSEPSGAGRSYYIGDFQKNTSSLEEALPDTSLVAFFIPLSAQRSGNVYVDSCWFDSPVTLAGQTVRLLARVRNESGDALSGQPVRLFVDGVQRSVGSYDLEAGEETVIELNWTIDSPGYSQGRLEIIDYPVTFDDQLFFSYAVRSEIPVLSIDQSGQRPFLNAMFGKDSIFAFQTTPVFSIDYSAFSDYNLIVLNGLDMVSPGLAVELQGFVERGGSLVVFPGRDIDLVSYRAFLEGMGLDRYVALDTTFTGVSSINELHPVYREVFDQLPENLNLPEVQRHYVISRPVHSLSQNLLQLQNGHPFFNFQAVGRGGVYLSAVPLEDGFSNFQRHTVFVPTMFNIAIQSHAYQPLYHVLGNHDPLLVRDPGSGEGQVFRIQKGDWEMIPEQRLTGTRLQLFVHDQITESGNYMLLSDNAAVGALSFNYDRRESVLDAFSPGELSRALLDAGLQQVQIIDAGTGNFERALQEFSKGRQLWRLFLLLALAFLLAEVVLLRFRR